MTQRIGTILEAVSKRVGKLVPAERFYVALYNSTTGELSFPLVKEKDTILPENQSPWTPRPCNLQELPGMVILSTKNLLFKDGLVTRLAQDKLQYWPGDVLPHSWLGVPLKVEERVLGALVVESWQKLYSFSQDHEKTLVQIANQVANALENARLTEQIKQKNKQLEQKVNNLRTLHQIGQQLSRGLVKSEFEILELLYKKGILELHIDTQNMYIAFYDRDPQNKDTTDEVYGTLRYMLRLKNGQSVSKESQPAKNTLTGHVIRQKKSFNPPNVEKAYQTYTSKRSDKKTLSWLGVPMLSEGDVFGVIVLRNYKFEHTYTEDDQEMLEILAGQAAIALQNLRLYQAEQRERERKNAAENMAIMGLMGAEFAHKMNNLAGTIPVRIGMAKKLLDANAPKEKILEQLTKIEKEANGILKAAEEIRQSRDTGLNESINVNQIIEIAVRRAQNLQTNTQNKVETKLELLKDLPPIIAERNSFLDTLSSIIKNGYESISGTGLLTIETRQFEFNERAMIEIKITDTGKGIPSSDLPKIFDLFYTTKGKGLGFGLWKDRVLIKKLGGELEVQSDVEKGSTFTIRIPISRNIQTSS